MLGAAGFSKPGGLFKHNRMLLVLVCAKKQKTYVADVISLQVQMSPTSCYPTFVRFTFPDTSKQ